MKLIASLTSPYVRKIRIALLEKGLTFELVNEPPWEPGNKVCDYNPLGKVPALQADDGEIFFNSPVIADYLESLPAAVRLIPVEALEAVRVKQLEALADGVTDAGVVWLLETRRAADKQDATVIDRQRGKIERGLDALEHKLQGRDWLYGTHLSLADIAAGCCVLWLDFRLPQYDWRSSRPNLTAYAKRLAERAAFVQTVPVV
jgi:glutathione S-transferase